jgi:hypothetical protein
VLFAFSAIVSAVHVPGGTFIHSAVALVPHASILALEGIVAAVAWVALRRRGWDVEAATRVFVGGAVGFAIISTIWATLSTQATWDARRDDLRFVARALDDAGAPATDRVMSIDAGGTKYWSGRGGTVLVNDPLETIEEVARAYDIRWLVLQRADSVASVAPILDGDERPAWVGAPVGTRPTASGAGPAAPLDGAVDLGVYPVCTEPSDRRCVGEAAP